MKSNAKGPRVWSRMIPDVACEHLRWPLYASAVHPPRRVSAALNGFALWNVWQRRPTGGTRSVFDNGRQP